MKAKDQVSFYDAISFMEIDSLEKIREILLTKKMTDNNISKLNLVDVAIEEKHRRKGYMEKLWGDEYEAEKELQNSQYYRGLI